MEEETQEQKEKATREQARRRSKRQERERNRRKKKPTIFLVIIVSSESNVRQYCLAAAGPIRPSLAWCFSVARGSVLEAWAVMLELISSGFRKRC